MEAQLQIRQNAQEIQDYMKDLLDWQSDVKKKESKLKQQPGKVLGSTVPLRGKALSAPISAPSAELQQPSMPYFKAPAAEIDSRSSETLKNKKSNAAHHTYTSYGKWDKFDVDAALESSDDEDTKKPQSKKVFESAHPSGIKKSSARPSPSTPNGAPATNAEQPVFMPGESLNTVIPAKIQTITRHLQSPNPSAIPDDPEPLMKPISTKYTPKPVSKEATSKSDGAPVAIKSDDPPIRNQSHHAPQTSDAWRLRGNDLFKAKEWAMAKECYSRSILLQPTAAALANRALTDLKLGNWQAAESDCDASLDLDPKFVKAYLRRGEARRKQGRLLDAAEDFEAVVLLEPSNTASSVDRDACLHEFLSQEGLSVGDGGDETRLHVTGGPRVQFPPPKIVSIDSHSPAKSEAEAGAEEPGKKANGQQEQSDEKGSTGKRAVIVDADAEVVVGMVPDEQQAEDANNHNDNDNGSDENDNDNADADASEVVSSSPPLPAVALAQGEGEDEGEGHAAPHLPSEEEDADGGGASLLYDLD